MEQVEVFFQQLNAALNGLPPSPEREKLLARLQIVSLEHTFLHTVCDNSQDLCALKDQQGRYLYANKTFLEMFKPGSLEALRNKTDFDIRSRPQAEKVRDDDHAVLSGLKKIEAQLEPLQLGNGSEKWAQTTKVALQDSSGRLRAIGDYSRIISEGEHGEAFLKNVISNARCILWNARVRKVEKEFQWTTTVLSSNLSRTEMGVHESGSKLWDALVSQEELSRMNALAQQALLRRAGGYEHEFQIRGLDGAFRNVKESVRISAISSVEWNLVGVAVDVTAQEQAEKELQHSLSIVSATIESSDDGILVVNTQGKIVFFNSRFAEMWGIPNHIIMSGDDEQALSFAANLLADPQAFIQRIHDAYAQPDAVIYDLLKFKDGRIFERHSQPQRDGGSSVGRVWVFRDISQRARMEEQLAAANARLIKLVKEDVLTGLLNRRTVLESAELEWSRWQRTHKPFSVLLLDIDDFKKINDKHGHLMGDRALKSLADSLKDSIRGLDMVGRYGGEEFVVILPETPLAGAEVVGEKVLQNIRKLQLQSGPHAIPLTASMGVAAARPEDKDVDTLIHRADLAMYAAKRGGKDTLRSAME